MPLRPETFGYLPPLSAQQIEAQVQYALNHGWIPHVEFTETANSAEFYWKNWPLRPARVDTTGKGTLTSSQIVNHLESCGRRHPYASVRFAAYNPKTRSTELAFVVKTAEEGQ
ncbi:MAG: ribulose bisphosphate carboxylase small subunit [Alphaproteobacteria bacterium]